MLEIRSRLGEELTRQLTRWRNAAVAIVQAALAAGLSWLVACISSTTVLRSSRRWLPSCASASRGNRNSRRVVVRPQGGHQDHELAHQRLDQARPPQRGPRLPPDSRVDGPSLLVLRLPEVVRVRGAGADSLYQQRPADFLDVPHVRHPGRELVSRRVGVVIRRALVSGILVQATWNSGGSRLVERISVYRYGSR